MTAIDASIFAPASERPSPGRTGRVIRPRLIRLTGPMLTSVTALLSAGLLPLFAWLWQWNTVVRQDLCGTRERTSTSLLRGAALVTTIVLLGTLVELLLHGTTVPRAYHLLLGNAVLMLFEHHRRFVSFQPAIFWNRALLVAYGCYWVAVRKHVRRVSRAAGRPRLDTGLSAGWILGGIGFGVAHLWWGIPMLLAGAQQRRYLTGTHLRWREDGAMIAKPTVCPTPRCGTELAIAAQFCPRCGSARH